MIYDMKQRATLRQLLQILCAATESVESASWSKADIVGFPISEFDKENKVFSMHCEIMMRFVSQ